METILDAANRGRPKRNNKDRFRCEMVNDGQNNQEASSVYTFQPDIGPNPTDRMEADKYAPQYINPYYMSIPARCFVTGTFEHAFWADDQKHWPQMTVVMEQLGARGAYLSLKFLQDLATDKVDWESLRNKKRITIEYENDEQKKKEAEELKEMYFVGLTENAGRGPRLRKRERPEEENGILRRGQKGDIDTKDARIYIPMRHPNGRLAWVLLQNFASWKSYEHQRCQQLSDVKDIFAKIWIELFKNPDAESVASYKPRYSTEELHFNLAIVPGSSVGILKPQIDGSQTKAIKFLEDTIVAVNKPKGKSKSNSKKAQVKPPTDLKLKKGTKPKEVDDKPRMKLELKTAAAIAYDYIKIGENPLGLFSTYIKLDDFNNYMKTLEAPRVELLSKQARINAARKAPSTSESKEMEDANVNDCIMKSGQLSVRQKAGQEKVTIENHKTTLVVPISCLKIQEALGQRAAKNAPGRVMGMSASVCAEAYLGWDKLPYNDTEKSRGMMLRNGLYMAEWLHLSAFSWGGLLGLPRSNVSNPPQHETSDVPENLVLGTSETNSQMTRFEKAWQALVRDETILTDNPDFSAVLKVIRNPDQIGIIPHDERKATGNCHYVQGKTTLTEDHRKTAKEFKFVAYAVHYCIKFPTGCRLLRLEAGKELSTEFYPFLRPLYHKLEADLDRLLYDQLKEIWDTDAEGPDLANKLQAQTNNTNPFSSPMRTNNPNLMWQGSNAGLLSSNPYFNTPLLNNTLPYFLSGLTIGCPPQVNNTSPFNTKTSNSDTIGPLDEEKGPGKKLMG